MEYCGGGIGGVDWAGEVAVGSGKPLRSCSPDIPVGLRGRCPFLLSCENRHLNPLRGFPDPTSAS